MKVWQSTARFRGSSVAAPHSLSSCPGWRPPVWDFSRVGSWGRRSTIAPASARINEINHLFTSKARRARAARFSSEWGRAACSAACAIPRTRPSVAGELDPIQLRRDRQLLPNAGFVRAESQARLGVKVCVRRYLPEARVQAVSVAVVVAPQRKVDVADDEMARPAAAECGDDRRDERKLPGASHAAGLPFGHHAVQGSKTW